MADCVSCRLHNTNGRAWHRQVKPGVYRCGTCNRSVCKHHARRHDGLIECAMCAKKRRRESAEKLWEAS